MFKFRAKRNNSSSKDFVITTSCDKSTATASEGRTESNLAKNSFLLNGD